MLNYGVFTPKNGCVDDDNGPVHNCAIVDNSHEYNVAAGRLSKLPTDYSHTDIENDATFCDVSDDDSAICKLKQNYARVANSSKAGVEQCSNSLRYRNCVDWDNSFEYSDSMHPLKSFGAIKYLSIKTQEVCGSTSTIDNSIETENRNILNNLPDIDAELHYTRVSQ